MMEFLLSLGHRYLNWRVASLERRATVLQHKLRRARQCQTAYADGLNSLSAPLITLTVEDCIPGPDMVNSPIFNPEAAPLSFKEIIR